MTPWRTIARQEVLRFGRYLTVERHQVGLPDGRIIEDWAWLTMPDFVNVVPVTSDGRAVCFRQTKYAVRGVSLGVVGGYIEPGEAPLAGAQRELQEETGYTASQWIPLGEYPVDGNRGAGTACPFLALGAAEIGGRIADDLEEQELILLSRAELADGLDSGAFKAMPWALTVALALRKWV